MNRAARILVSLALVPLFLAAGAALGHVGNLLSHGNGWYILVGMALGAFALGALAPHRWVVPATLAALLALGWLAGYGDGDDMCEGRTNCEDNFGPWLSFWVPFVFVVLPTGLGAVVRAFWPRRRAPTTSAPAEPTAQP